MSPRTRLGCLPVPQPATFAALLATALVPVTAGSAAAATAAAGHDARMKRSHARAKRRQKPTCPGARLPQVTISPLPGAAAASPRTQISFLGAQVSQLRSIFVIGSITGRHAGRLRSYSSAAGASFVPDAPFAEGERVSVCATVRTPSGPRRVATGFEVATLARLAYQTPFELPGTRGDMQTYHSTDVKPPKVAISHPAGEASALGDLFAAPYAGPGEHGAMIFESNGRLIWFHRPPNPNWGIADLRPQSFEGHQDLVWWQGAINTYGFGMGEDVIASEAYEPVAKVRGGNGLQADLHDIELTPAGAAFITAYQPVRATVRVPGAPRGRGTLRSETVLDAVVQEVDVRTGLVMWEWQSLGHVPVSESHLAPPRGGAPWDCFHLDSLQQLPDGDLLIGARNTWAVYDVRMHTGRIAWQLGGRHSSFALGAGVRFGWIEGAQMLPGEALAVYDGGASFNPAVSGSRPAPRGELVSLDLATMSASLAGPQLRRSTGAPRPIGQGSLQPLAGGNWLIGWSGVPNFTEFDREGNVVYDAQFPAGEVGYRVYRAPWHGQPTAAPNVVTSTNGASTTVYVSWNGATGVSAWRLAAGPSPAALEPVATVADAGFETQITTHAAAYVLVQALGPAGEVLSESKTIAAAHA